MAGICLLSLSSENNTQIAVQSYKKMTKRTKGGLIKNILPYRVCKIEKPTEYQRVAVVYLKPERSRKIIKNIIYISGTLAPFRILIVKYVQQNPKMFVFVQTPRILCGACYLGENKFADSACFCLKTRVGISKSAVPKKYNERARGCACLRRKSGKKAGTAHHEQY